MRWSLKWSVLGILPALAIGLGVLAAAPDAAQQTTPAAQRRADNTPHPVAFHNGSCQKPDAKAAYTLGDVGPQQKDDGQSVTTDDIRGKLTTPPILTGSGTADVKLDDLLDTSDPYVLVVHQSAQDFGTLLACGEVAGALVNDQITLALRPLTDAGYAGVAALGSTDDDKTAGSVVLFADANAFVANDRTPRAGTGGGGGTGTGGGANATRSAGAPAIIGSTGRATRAAGSQSGSGGITGGIAPTSPAGGERATRVPRNQRTPTAPSGTEVPTAAPTVIPPTDVPPTDVPPTEPPVGTPVA
jgi:hypothetical protein